MTVSIFWKIWINHGTFINRGKRLSPGTRQQLNDGDEIIVGKTFLRFAWLNNPANGMVTRQGFDRPDGYGHPDGYKSNG